MSARKKKGEPADASEQAHLSCVENDQSLCSVDLAGDFTYRLVGVVQLNGGANTRDTTYVRMPSVTEVPQVSAAVSGREQPSATEKLLSHFSSWYRLKKAVAWYMRFFQVLKGRLLSRARVIRDRGLRARGVGLETSLSVDDLRSAELNILRYVQETSFPEFYDREGTVNVKSSSLKGLNVTLKDGLSLALSDAGEEELFSSASSSSEGSYVSAPRAPEAALKAAAGTMEEVQEPEIVPEVHHYPIVSQRHTWCVDEEHLHYQASYQHQIVHGFSSTFIKAYRCFGRSRGRRLTILEDCDVATPAIHWC
ncbi:hypothetical protein FJT64_000917 [Amphibalanus amphitrite]|uniref:Uncharacterized protein n=1 Tax=Amphibalanus amphitrite TaxID=1232801 RepID=A0A6A4VVB1_AMPAM|nr:hypothetical protein FJT64_000917 [Amphibalanus amphitrite]